MQQLCTMCTVCYKAAYNKDIVHQCAIAHQCATVHFCPLVSNCDCCTDAIHQWTFVTSKYILYLNRKTCADLLSHTLLKVAQSLPIPNFSFNIFTIPQQNLIAITSLCLTRAFLLKYRASTREVIISPPGMVIDRTQVTPDYLSRFLCVVYRSTTNRLAKLFKEQQLAPNLHFSSEMFMWLLCIENIQIKTLGW